MYIYNAQLVANPGASGAIAGHMGGYRDALTEATGLNWSAWAGIAGVPYGSFSLSARGDGLNAIIEGFKSAGGSEAFQTLSAETGHLTAGPAQVRLDETIATTGDRVAGQPVAVWTRATAAGGQLSAATAWAVEMMEYITTLTGVGGGVAMSAAGSMFELSWIMTFESGEALDKLSNKVQTDPGYIERLDAAGDYFIDGSSERSMAVRMP